MVRLTFVDDATPYYDELDALTTRNKDDFIVPESYYDGPASVLPADRPVPAGFLNNYRNDEEHLLLAFDEDDGSIVGYMSFGTDFEREDFPVVCPCVYFSRTIVDRLHRGEGIGSTMMDYLLSKVLPSLITDETVLLRKTWSTNSVQLNAYEKYGFTEYSRDKNARGDGVDSVWFTRPIDSL